MLGDEQPRGPKKYTTDGYSDRSTPLDRSSPGDESREAELLQTRKQALLEMVAAPPSQKTTAVEKAASATAAAETDADAPESPPIVSKDENTESTPRRRMRLDLGAGRRMLFGALGLRNPKTKADEDKIRVDLMKGGPTTRQPQNSAMLLAG